MVFIEAAACGKPALAGQAGGTGAAVLDDVTGLRVDGTRLASVENALQQMLQSVNASAAMGQMGLARVLDDFSWEVVARKTAAMRHLNRG